MVKIGLHQGPCANYRERGRSPLYAPKCGHLDGGAPQ
jgi:hypothetical protein